MSEIADKDLVFLILDIRRYWLRQVNATKDFHTDKGYFKFNEIIGKVYGTTVELLPSHRLLALLKPLPSDIILAMKRESQIIYPEDIGLIITYGGVIPVRLFLKQGLGVVL